MKRLLLLLPLLLTACGGAADITTEEPFQITCTWTRGERSGDETYVIDPKLDWATLEVPVEDGELEEIEYAVRKVTPRKIVLGDEWYQSIEDDGSYSDWKRSETHVNRTTGELTYKEFVIRKGVTNQLDVVPTVAEGWKGTEQELAFEYDCQKPTRN